ncbi:hypothetical protein [Sulfurimonas sp. NW9]|uniref:hypothetical protein n=1 Tax=Sulfurimonas sp. NW9 TaxID=2922728 RepID=UPI003DA92632
MKLLFLLLVCISILYAKSDDTCYSVQLTSFKFKKNSTYDFAAHNYPKTCRLISFSNINSVRCGCYEKYRDATAALKKLSKKYPKPIIVNTYKYRFQKLKKLKKLKNYKKITKKLQKSRKRKIFQK